MQKKFAPHLYLLSPHKLRRCCGMQQRVAFVVVAQLVEWSLPILRSAVRIQSSSKIYLFKLNICLLSTVYWKDENKEKEARDGPFFKEFHFLRDNSFLLLCGKTSIYNTQQHQIQLIACSLNWLICRIHFWREKFCHFHLKIFQTVRADFGAFSFSAPSLPIRASLTWRRGTSCQGI